MIKQAQKHNITNISTLILDAIHNIANTLTGENEKSKILETLDKYITMDTNRLSYKNIWIYEKENQTVGLILAYNSNDVEKLDAPILKHLSSKNIFRDSFDKECFEDEFYIDTISVSEEFQGKGIAKEFFAFIEKEAKNVGFEKVSLLVDFKNPKALALYKKIGFKKNTILEVSNHQYHHMIKII